MEFDSEKLHTFRENQKTQFIASQFDTLAAQKVESEELAAADPEMAELAKDDIKNIETQMQALFVQMDEIIESSKEEEVKPYGVVLEVRAGAGGDEASLFAGELAQMYVAYAEN